MIRLKNTLRNFDRYRRAKMAGLEPMLYRLLNNKRNNMTCLLEKGEIEHIVILRNNRRIGNMLFLIPFVRQIRASYPKAYITLLLNQPWQREIFRHMGIDEFVFSHFSIKELGSFLRVMRAQRKKEIDLLIVPYSSVEDTMMAAMLRAKNKVARFNARREAAFTHTFKKKNDEQHAALSALYLLPALGMPLSLPLSHHLQFTQKEIAQGMTTKRALYDGERMCLAYFRGARGDKQLSDSAWLSLITRFENASSRPIQWVEILSPEVTTPLREGTMTFRSSDLRHLASVLKAMDAFICCDTGPLHLADAAGASCVGLYTSTNPDVFGVLGESSINVNNLTCFDVSAVLETVNVELPLRS